jgi:hypothetical protein
MEKHWQAGVKNILKKEMGEESGTTMIYGSDPVLWIRIHNFCPNLDPDSGHRRGTSASTLKGTTKIRQQLKAGSFLEKFTNYLFQFQRKRAVYKINTSKSTIMGSSTWKV